MIFGGKIFNFSERMAFLVIYFQILVCKMDIKRETPNLGMNPNFKISQNLQMKQSYFTDELFLIEMRMFHKVGINLERDFFYERLGFGGWES